MIPSHHNRTLIVRSMDPSLTPDTRMTQNYWLHLQKMFCSKSTKSKANETVGLVGSDKTVYCIINVSHNAHNVVCI